MRFTHNEVNFQTKYEYHQNAQEHILWIFFNNKHIWQEICQTKKKLWKNKFTKKWDLISEQQPSLLWSLMPNQLGHQAMCWMGCVE